MTDLPALFETAYYLATKYGIFVPVFDLAVKTYEYFQDVMRRLTQNLYDGFIGGEFITIMQNLISGQYNQAWRQAMVDNGLNPDEEMLPEWQQEIDDLIALEYTYVDGFYYEVLKARVDEKPVAPFLARTAMWANRWNEVYNRAKVAIADKGAKLEWIYGDTEHCSTCQRLNGLVAFASEWDKAGIRPQNAPNAVLECGGWKCKCYLRPTDKRRSPRAFDRMLELALKL